MAEIICCAYVHKLGSRSMASGLQRILQSSTARKFPYDDCKKNPVKQKLRQVKVNDTDTCQSTDLCVIGSTLKHETSDWLKKVIGLQCIQYKYDAIFPHIRQHEFIPLTLTTGMYVLKQLMTCNGKWGSAIKCVIYKFRMRVSLSRTSNSWFMTMCAF